MALQLLMGGSGSGKTSYLYERIIGEAIREPDRNFFLIVPEQSTMQVQKDIVLLHPCHGTMNIDVLSFNRLAHRVFSELAVETLQILDDTGKSMVLRRTAAARRSELVLYGKNLGKNGLIGQLKSAVSEFYQYGITPEQLTQLSAAADSAGFSRKLADLAIIFAAFSDYIEGRFLAAEQLLDVLCRYLPQSQLIRGSTIALDGFTGFTPIQYRIAELFLCYAKEVIVAVTADPRAPLYQVLKPQHLFSMSSVMVRKFSLLAERNGVTKRKDLVFTRTPRFQHAPALAFLERKLFRGGGEIYGENPGESLVLRQALSPCGEVAAMAADIGRLISSGQYRYRDIAVITGDLPAYGKEIARQFAQEQIPFFLDDKRPVTDNALVEFLRAALEAVRTDFSYDSVMRFLKSGLASSRREEIDRLENYVLALGIRGFRQFSSVWDFKPRGQASLDMEALNAFRDEAMGPLFVLRERLSDKNAGYAAMVQALRDLLAAYHVEETLTVWQEQFTAAQEYRLAMEYGQVYGLVDELFTRLTGLLGTEKGSRKEFAEILDAGFSEITVGVIPAAVDRIVVGDIERTRLEHVKVLFFIGINDGIVPRREKKAGLFTDREREFLAAREVELAPTVREENLRQRFYLYLVMTRPADRLILSYSALSADAKSLRPSYLIGEVRALFPMLVCRTPEKETEVFSQAGAARELAAALSAFRDGKPVTENRLLSLLACFLQDPARKEEAKRMLDAAFFSYTAGGIGREAARLLYGSVLSGSVTRLERFAGCAYAHFLQYGLALAERERFEIDGADIGTLFHDSIDLSFRRAKEEGLDWRLMTDARRDALAAESVAEAAALAANQVFAGSSRSEYLTKRVERMTKRTLRVLQQQLLRGDFTPADFEMAFSAADGIEALRIALPPSKAPAPGMVAGQSTDGEVILLRGRVDRLDLCESGGKIYVEIIDYKSGSTSFDLFSVYQGRQLQLTVYLDAVMELERKNHPGSTVVPAGVFYYNIADPVLDYENYMKDGGLIDPDRLVLKALRMNGLVNSDPDVIRRLDREIETKSDILPVTMKDGEVVRRHSSAADESQFERLRGFVRERIAGFGRQILDGDAAVAPYRHGGRTACDYCPYHPVCGLDRRTPGYGYRTWRSLTAEEIWEALCKKNP